MPAGKVGKINFTDRRRINRRDVAVTLMADAEKSTVWFDASIDLSGYEELPRDALVIVEAYRKTQRIRFPFGTIGELTVPAQNQRQLKNFTAPEGALFRIKVTDTTSGLILAEADRIRPGNENEFGGNKSLLPVEPADLDRECWRISFEEETGPVFLINQEFPNWQEESKSPRFRALVYPAVLREILARILWIENSNDMDDDEYWMSPWLRFAAKTLRADRPPDVGDRNDPTTVREIDNWIDSAVSAFCRRVNAYGQINREEQE